MRVSRSAWDAYASGRAGCPLVNLARRNPNLHLYFSRKQGDTQMQLRTCMLTRWLRGWGRLLHACSGCGGAYRKQRKAQQAWACCPG